MVSTRLNVVDSLLSDLDVADLKAVLAPFGRERTLPATAYTSSNVWNWERSHLWDRGWTAIGRARDFPPGTATAVTLGAESLIVANDGGALLVMFNVCRHRGHAILSEGEQRSTTSLRCPYHGWVYGLDGVLKAAPKMSHRGDLDDVQLIHPGVAQWRGWLFVALEPDPVPFAEYVGDLDDEVAPYEPQSLVSGARTSYDVAANWKLIHENYHECYHCPSIHPQLTAVANPDSGDNRTPSGAWIGGSLQLRPGAATLSLDGRSGGRPIDSLPETRYGEALYLGIIPNLLISLHPDYVITHRLVPMGPAATTIHCEWLFPEEAVADPSFDPAYAVDFWDVTNRQDWEACEALQRGAASRGFRPGVLGWGEDAVYQFQTTIARTYLGEPLTATVNPGRS